MRRAVIAWIASCIIPGVVYGMGVFGHDVEVCLSGFCKVEDWYCSPGEDFLLCIHAKSVKRMSDGSVRYWELEVPKKGNTLTRGGEVGKSVKSSMRVRCQDDSVAVEAQHLYADYFGHGEHIAKNIPYELRYEPIVPGTLGEDIAKAACRLAKKK